MPSKRGRIVRTALIRIAVALAVTTGVVPGIVPGGAAWVASAAAQGGDPPVELIGLHRWTRTMVKDSLARHVPGSDTTLTTHACGAELMKLGFVRTAAIYFPTRIVVSVVEPQDAENVRVNPPVITTRPLASDWQAFLAGYLTPDGTFRNKTFEHGADLYPWIVAGKRDSLYAGHPVPAAFDSLWTFFRAHASPADLRTTIDILAYDSIASHRQLAFALLNNFTGDDAAWGALVHMLRTRNDIIGDWIPAKDQLNQWMHLFPRHVNWAPYVADLHALLAGANLWVMPDLMRVLVVTSVDSTLAKPILGQNAVFVLGYAASHDPHAAAMAQGLLARISGRSYGADIEAWRAWAETLSPTHSAAADAEGDGSVVSVIPRPSTLARAPGHFTLTAATTIWADSGMMRVARQFARAIEPATGYTVAVRTGSPRGGSRIVVTHDPALKRSLGPEGYRLAVRTNAVTITAAAPAGAFYALQTIKQLLPPEIVREARVNGTAWIIPALTIEDRPQYVWRGSHLDVSRHFMPKEFVKKYIDLMSSYKMNTFHWHLTDDQGWRIEIKKYPRLTRVGAWRNESLIGHAGTSAQYDHVPHGGFYTQDDVREIVAYAADRFVTIVPEIEMPGHEQAAVAAYPWLGSRPDTAVDVWTTWGVSEFILNPSDSTIGFMRDVLTEVMALFPGKFIHIGGDEAVKTQWKASPLAQSRIKQLGLADEDALQGWFIRQIDAFLVAHGRRLVGWDEILDGGGLPASAVVMSWRGMQGGLAGAREGHDVVMTPAAKTYLDHSQIARAPESPPVSRSYLPIDTVYAFTPTPSELEPKFAAHVLGGQAQLWTEYMPDPKRVEYMAFPRLCAMAEALWTPPARKDYENFRERLPAHLTRLRMLDVNVYDGTY